MQDKLSHDSRYDEVWSTDYGDYGTSFDVWRSFQPKAGDIFLWNTDQVTHAALGDGKAGLYYAGSDAPRGFRHKPVEFFTGTPDNPTNYGPPTKIFRYKNIQETGSRGSTVLQGNVQD